MDEVHGPRLHVRRAGRRRHPPSAAGRAAGRPRRSTDVVFAGDDAPACCDLGLPDRAGPLGRVVVVPAPPVPAPARAPREVASCAGMAVDPRHRAAGFGATLLIAGLERMVAGAPGRRLGQRSLHGPGVLPAATVSPSSGRAPSTPPPPSPTTGSAWSSSSYLLRDRSAIRDGSRPDRVVRRIAPKVRPRPPPFPFPAVGDPQEGRGTLPGCAVDGRMHVPTDPQATRVPPARPLLSSVVSA